MDRGSLIAALLVPLLAPACVPLEGGGDAGPPAGPATALFEVPRTGQPQGEYYALPFPNDLRVRADGTLDLDAHVRPNVLIDEYLATISAGFAGFGTNSAIFCRFDAPIDPASLPADPTASLDPAASVYLVDVDADSPSRGERVPLRFRFETHDGESIARDRLAALPYPGFPLRPATTYALVVTARLRAPDGSPVGRAADLDAILAAVPPADPDLAAAAAVYAPLADYLDEPGGDERADVVSAAVFTTQDPTALLGKLRTAVHATAEPALAGTTLDSDGDGFTVFAATYDTPIFQAGEIPYLQEGGEILTDESGAPIVQGTQTVRVALSVPDGPVPASGWPVVIYAHGTGGSYKSFVSDGTARRFAAEGFAVIGADQTMNGTRVPQGTSPELAFYNFQNPIAGRDNSRQNGADHFQMVRLAAAAVIPAPVSGDGRVHTFDPARRYFFGHSQGGITGPLAVAFEPDVRGAIFSGAGGLLYWALLLKTMPVDIAGLLSAFIRDQPLDEFNNILALVQLFIEPADPINYARLITREPPPGLAVRDVYQSQGLVDNFTPVPAIEALGVALGGEAIGPLIEPLPGFELAGRTLRTAPVAGNLNGHTVVFVQYTAPSGSDGHFVVFTVEDARRHHVQFLKTLDQDGTATLVP